MPIPCRHKIRFATKEFAEAQARDIGPTNPHRKMQAYYCAPHGCWHIGHAGHERGDGNTATADTIGRLRTIIQQLIVAHGQTKNPTDWQGVRILKRAIIHLQA